MYSCIRPSVMLLPRYMWCALMDFYQTFVNSVSWDKDELIRFWGQKSKVKVAAWLNSQLIIGPSGRRRTELNAVAPSSNRLVSTQMCTTQILTLCHHFITILFLINIKSYSATQIHTIWRVLIKIGVFWRSERPMSLTTVHPLKPISQLRFDCDTTTIRLRRKSDLFIFCSRRMEAGACETS